MDNSKKNYSVNINGYSGLHHLTINYQSSANASPASLSRRQQVRKRSSVHSLLQARNQSLSYILGRPTNKSLERIRNARDDSDSQSAESLMVSASRIVRHDESRDSGFPGNGGKGANEDINDACVPRMLNQARETPGFEWTNEKDDAAELKSAQLMLAKFNSSGLDKRHKLRLEDLSL